MGGDEKSIVIFETIVMIIVGIYIYFLNNYRKVLYTIQKKYEKESRIVQAWYTVKEPDYLIYFILGILFGIVLIALFLWNIKENRGLGLSVLILLVFNIVCFVVLIMVFWDPVFTAMLTLITTAAILIYLKSL